MLVIAAVNDGHTAVAIDRSIIAVVARNNTLGVDGAATGGMATSVGVA